MIPNKKRRSSKYAAEQIDSSISMLCNEVTTIKTLCAAGPVPLQDFVVNRYGALQSHVDIIADMKTVTGVGKSFQALYEDHVFDFHPEMTGVIQATNALIRRIKNQRSLDENGYLLALKFDENEQVLQETISGPVVLGNIVTDCDAVLSLVDRS